MRPTIGGTVPIAAVCILIVAAAFVGLVFGALLRRHAPAALDPSQIAGAGVQLRVPDGWEPADDVVVPGFHGALTLRNPDQDLCAAVARLPATSATLLPAAFLRSLKGAPGPPSRVWLGPGHDAWR